MYKAISTKYRGPTDTRGARMSARDCDGNRVTLSYDHALDIDENHTAAARALAAKLDWPGRWVGGSFGKAGRAFVQVYEAPQGYSHVEAREFTVARKEVV